MENSAILLGTVMLIVLMTSEVAHAHGYLSWPPSRASCWRHGYRGCVPNYDDNGLNCGGFSVQWELNGGRCGVCGEAYSSVITHQGAYRAMEGFHSGDVIDIGIVITAPHKGWHEFRICDVDNEGGLTQHCLDQKLLQLTDLSGSRWHAPTGRGSHWVRLQLPVGVRCKHCVIQWKWNTGNRWGCDEVTGCCVGCGPQEQFYGCADVTIT